VKQAVPGTAREETLLASQGRMMWWKFRKHKAAVVCLFVLGFFYLVAAFCEFVTPADPRRDHPEYVYAPPQRIRFVGPDGFRLRPFVYGMKAGVLDESVKHWDVATGTEGLNLREHVGQAWCVAFSPQGRWVAAGEDRRVRVWNAATGEAVLNPKGHTGQVSSVAFSPDGRLLVSASSDGTVRIQDVAEGSEAIVCCGHEGAVTSVAFSPDGGRVVSGGEDATVRMWDATTGKQLFEAGDHTAMVTGVAFSPDGRVVASASRDRTVILRDATTGEVGHALEHDAAVLSIAFSPRANHVAVVSGGSIVLRDAATGAAVRTFAVHGAETAVFSPDGSRMACGSSDGTVTILDADDGDEVATLVGHTAPVRGLAFSPDGRSLASVSSGQTWTRIYTVDRAKVHSLRLFAKGDPYRLFGLIPMETHLVGLSDGSPLFLLGADHLGRDLLSQIIYGARVSLSIGLVGVVLTMVIGVAIGGISGYMGGRIDNFIQRFIETLMCLPTLPLWMGLSAALPATWPPLWVYFGVVAILSLLGWTGLARVVRGKVLSLRDEDYVIAAELAGATRTWTIRRHLLPSLFSYLVVSVTLSVPGMILGETTLSYLGIGLRAPVVSWGVLLQQAQTVQTVSEHPWILAPAVFIIVVVLAFNFVGDGLRDAADPYST